MTLTQAVKESEGLQRFLAQLRCQCCAVSLKNKRKDSTQ